MEEIQAPKKERKFLKVLGEIALTLFRELLLNMGKKVINKVGNKRQNLVIAFLMVAGISYASVDSIPYPITTNKQKLGWQTTGNGLVYRGRASDTITKPSNYTNKDIKAYLLVDTVNNVMYSYIASKGGWQFNNSDTVIIQGVTMPFDSITFNTANNSTVGVGEVEYNDTQGSLIQGLKGGNVTNVIGQQLHQRVNNRTGAPLAKGDVVYLSGSQGNRITVAKALATSDPTSANTFGIVAESIADNQSGYIITEGLITGLNTSFLTQDSAVYLSGTTAGALTSIKPQAPIHGVYIGVCVKTNAGSGEVFVKIRNGQELDELHDVQISSPFDNASLYYKSSDGLWRDTTAALLVSDTALMLTPYLRKLDTVSLSNRINLKLNISDTASMLTPYFKDSDTTSLNLTSRFAAKLNISDTASMLTNYLRTGVAASTYLTQSNAASTYLPLTGGTLTGTLNATNVSLNSNLTISDIIPNNPPSIFTSVTTGPSTSATVKFGLNQSLGSGGANMFMGGTQIGGGNVTNPNIFFTDTRRAYASIQGIYTGAGITSSGHIVFNTTPNDATTALTERMRIASDGAITMGGTLGVSSNITANSFIKSGGTSSQFLKADGSVDANTYLTTASASNYLPLTGGTLSGSILNSWTASYSSAPRNDGAVRRTYTQNLYSANGGTTDRVTHYYTFSLDECCASAPVTMYYGRFNGFYNQANIIYDASIYYHNNNQFYYRAFSESENKVTFSIKPSTTVNSISGTKADLYLSGDAQIDRSLNIGTTLSVTGATNISNTLSATTGTFTGLNVNNTNVNGEGILTLKSNNFNFPNRIQFGDGSVIRKEITQNAESNMLFRTFAVGGGEGGYSFYTRRNPNNEILSFVIDRDGNSNFYGTLGVTGATTLSAPLTVNSSAVFNEGSTDSDFRVESDGNANMVFVDASTDRVGIGTNAPSKTLEVNGTINATGDITEGGLNVLTSADTASLSSRIDGKVSLTATESISGTKTFNNLVNLTSNLILSGSYSQTNKLLGKNSSDGVGNITVGSGLNLTSDILTATNPTEKYYFNLGIVAGAADNSASTYDFTYGSNIFIVPTSLNGYCIDTVHIRAIGCSTCPPVAGDKDYYVGVYKANAGARVTTSGATLVGSQITMNEYDLNEVNRNDTLSTGEAWWVYLNGTYTSDMAYVTAGFIVKKTCN